MVVIALSPFYAMAQSEWERPLTAAEQLEKAKQAEAEAKRAVKEAKKAAKRAAKEEKRAGKTVPTTPTQMPTTATIPAKPSTPSKPVANEKPIPTSTPQPVAPIVSQDAPYLAGAVPVVDGKVVFILNLDVPGKNAAEIYDAVYAFLDAQAKEECQKEESGISLFNKTEHVIAARYSEWLQFRKNMVVLDQTEFNYTIIAYCTDGHLKMTLERISYVYEENRTDAIREPAENWITDERALNKKKTKLAPLTGKFRRKTIDRKNEIFSKMRYVLNSGTQAPSPAN